MIQIKKSNKIVLGSQTLKTIARLEGGAQDFCKKFSDLYSQGTHAQLSITNLKSNPKKGKQMKLKG